MIEPKTSTPAPAMTVRPPQRAAARPMGMAPTAKATMKIEVRSPISAPENVNLS